MSQKRQNEVNYRVDQSSFSHSKEVYHGLYFVETFETWGDYFPYSHCIFLKTAPSMSHNPRILLCSCIFNLLGHIHPHFLYHAFWWPHEGLTANFKRKATFCEHFQHFLGWLVINYAFVNIVFFMRKNIWFLNQCLLEFFYEKDYYTYYL